MKISGVFRIVGFAGKRRHPLCFVDLCAPTPTIMRKRFFLWECSLRVQRSGPFLEGPEMFSHPKSHIKISNFIRDVLVTYP